MSNPVVWCETCQMRRDVMLHARAEFPPDAAKNWLRRRCRGRVSRGGTAICGIEQDSPSAVQLKDKRLRSPHDH